MFFFVYSEVCVAQTRSFATHHREQLLLRDEITSLKQENNALRGSLAQMRKSNVQVRALIFSNVST